MIKFENITKKFKNTTVISNMNLEIKEGELVAFIGKSGCGKTTTLKMINRLVKPTSGKLLIHGEDVLKADIIKLRRKMGYVIQQTGLFPHMTIRENIELIPKLEKIEKEKIAQKTMELLEMVGMDESYLNRYPSELSGGQQQRIGVARAFALDPEVILMDEPFSALDPLTREALQDELIDLQSKVKKTIVFVTHDMDEAVRIADRICIMNEGKIVQYDTPETILKNPVSDFVSEFVGKKRIWNSPEYIRAQDIMIENPIGCHETISLFRAMEKMRANKVDSLMVTEARTNRLLGILTIDYGRRFEDKSIPVKEVMKTNYSSVEPEDHIIDILKLVDKIDLSCIPVVDSNRKLVGLLTKRSLISTLSQQYIEDGGNVNELH
ncbi:MAG: ABC transporter ATP-binding protein [Anaerorhabdus sp.]